MASSISSVDATKPNLILLLQVIRSHGDIEPLIRKGLETSQIAALTREAKSVGLVERGDKGLRLSASGERLLAESIRKRAPGQASGWIRPAEEHRIRQLSEEDPFLPEVPPRAHN
jgi:hypothetical protein